MVGDSSSQSLSMSDGEDQSDADGQGNNEGQDTTTVTAVEPAAKELLVNRLAKVHIISSCTCNAGRVYYTTSSNLSSITQFLTAPAPNNS